MVPTIMILLLFSVCTIAIQLPHHIIYIFISTMKKNNKKHKKENLSRWKKYEENENDRICTYTPCREKRELSRVGSHDIIIITHIQLFHLTHSTIQASSIHQLSFFLEKGIKGEKGEKNRKKTRTRGVLVRVELLE